MKLTRSIFLIVSFIGCVFARQICHAQSQAPSPSHIAVILPLSGDFASVGNAVKNGIDLAYEELSPEQRSKIVVHFEDDRGQSLNSISAFRKLQALYSLSGLISPFSGAGNALAPLAERARVPFIAIASDGTISRGRSYTKILWVTPEAESKVLHRRIKEEGYKTIARISTIHDGSIAGNRAFDQDNDGYLTLAIDQQFPLDVKDFRPFLIKVAQLKKVDAIMSSLMPGQLGLFARQARQLGIQLPIFGWEMFEDPAEVLASEGALVGQWYVCADEPDAAFMKKYLQRFPQAAFIASANSHDALLLLAAALEKSQDTAEVAKFLGSVRDFRGALGTFSATSDNRFDLPAAIKIVTKAGFERLPSKSANNPSHP